MAPKGRAEGPATVLAIGTANPERFMEQSTYPDYLFGVTNSNHKVELKKKFQRMCDKSGIQKRHFHLTEEVVRANPEIGTYMHPSLDIRQDIAVTEVPRLAQEASLRAIEEWGRPKSDITHVVFTTTSSVDMPGADFQLVKLLGLAPTTQRVMMYLQGCFAGATVIRLAKDLAENNKGARVLAVCSEVTALTFIAPDENHLDGLVGSALFGDGAAALIVGSDPVPQVERPLFEIHWAGERIVPDSDGAINGHLRQAGLLFHLLKDVPGLVSTNIEQVVLGSFEDFEFPGYNDIFWAVHPGGPAILDQIEDRLSLHKDKFQASRDVLASYGNMSSSAVIFALDNVRTRSKEMNLSTTGEGCEWGILLGFGPGMTIESVVLKSLPLAN